MTVNDDEREKAWYDTVRSPDYEPYGSNKDHFKVGWDAHAALAVPAGKGETVSRDEVRKRMRDAAIRLFWRTDDDGEQLTWTVDDLMDALMPLVAPSSRKATKELTVGEKPPLPSDQQLLEYFESASPEDAVRADGVKIEWFEPFYKGLRAVWRAGCDTGMVVNDPQEIFDLIAKADERKTPVSARELRPSVDALLAAAALPERSLEDDPTWNALFAPSVPKATKPGREALAREIVHHFYIGRSAGQEAHCQCGGWVEGVQRRPITTWNQHVADALLASDLWEGGE